MKYRAVAEGVDLHRVDGIVREATTGFLRNAGMIIEDSGSYDAFVAKTDLIELRPDIVITDFRLPDERTALDVANYTWKKWGEDMPLLVLTGEALGSQHITDKFPSGSNVAVCKKPISGRSIVAQALKLCRQTV